MRRYLSLLLAMSSSAFAAGAAEPFAINLPRDFTGPMASSFGADRSFAYIRPTENPNARCLFQVTISAIPEGEKSDGLETRLDRLLRGFAGRRKGFTKASSVKTTLSGLAALSVDWSGEAKGQPMKGRLICAVYQGALVQVVFEDTTGAWEKTVAELEKALTTFKLQ